MLLKFNYNVSFAEKNYHNILSQWFAKKKKLCTTLLLLKKERQKKDKPRSNGTPSSLKSQV